MTVSTNLGSDFGVPLMSKNTQIEGMVLMIFYALQSVSWLVGPYDEGGHGVLYRDSFMGPIRVLVWDPNHFGLPAI